MYVRYKLRKVNLLFFSFYFVYDHWDWLGIFKYEKDALSFIHNRHIWDILKRDPKYTAAVKKILQEELTSVKG